MHGWPPDIMHTVSLVIKCWGSTEVETSIWTLYAVLNPNKVDVWNPCQVWRGVAPTTTLKKCYKLPLFHQIVSQIRAYIRESMMMAFSVFYIALLIKKTPKIENYLNNS